MEGNAATRTRWMCLKGATKNYSRVAKEYLTRHELVKANGEIVTINRQQVSPCNFGQQSVRENIVVPKVMEPKSGSNLDISVCDGNESEGLSGNSVSTSSYSSEDERRSGKEKDSDTQAPSTHLASGSHAEPRIRTSKLCDKEAQIVVSPERFQNIMKSVQPQLKALESGLVFKVIRRRGRDRSKSYNKVQAPWKPELSQPLGDEQSGEPIDLTVGPRSQLATFTCSVPLAMTCNNECVFEVRDASDFRLSAFKSPPKSIVPNGSGKQGAGYSGRTSLATVMSSPRISKNKRQRCRRRGDVGKSAVKKPCLTSRIGKSRMSKRKTSAPPKEFVKELTDYANALRNKYLEHDPGLSKAKLTIMIPKPGD